MDQESFVLLRDDLISRTQCFENFINKVKNIIANKSSDYFVHYSISKDSDRTHKID